MVLHGRIEHGAVIVSGDVLLPEGAAVTVIVQVPSQAASKNGSRVELPLVKSQRPGTLQLTEDRAAEILDDDDISG